MAHEGEGVPAQRDAGRVRKSSFAILIALPYILLLRQSMTTHEKSIMAFVCLFEADLTTVLKMISIS